MINALPNYNLKDLAFTPLLVSEEEFDEWLKGGLKEAEKQWDNWNKRKKLILDHFFQPDELISFEDYKQNGPLLSKLSQYKKPDVRR